MNSDYIVHRCLYVYTRTIRALRCARRWPTRCCLWSTGGASSDTCILSMPGYVYIIYILISSYMILRRCNLYYIIKKVPIMRNVKEKTCTYLMMAAAITIKYASWTWLLVRCCLSNTWISNMRTIGSMAGHEAILLQLCYWLQTKYHSD
jgi:hypothetical protein